MAVQSQVMVLAPARPARRFRINPAYIFLLPYLVAMVMFSLGPAVYAFILMFATFKVGRPQFFQAGFKNIVTALNDPFLLPACTDVRSVIFCVLVMSVRPHSAMRPSSAVVLAS